MILNQNNFNKLLEKKFLFEKYPRAAIAVSGGPDSMALTQLLHKWTTLNKGSIQALIIDHQIRDESNIEANIVREYLEKKKINSKLFIINNSNVKKKTMNEARKNRYDKLISYCKNNDIFKLFVAHHYDDNLETFVLRKIGGSNFQGLRAMKVHSILNGIEILRPLLYFNKKKITNFNKKNNIFYVSDPSNLNEKYSRIAVRNFLEKQKEFKKNIIYDFEKIKKYYPLYKKMIFQKFIKLNLFCSKNEIHLDSYKFFQSEIQIQAKIIELVFNYMKPNKKFTRYKKILNFLDILNSHENETKTIFSGINVKKDEILIRFSIQ